MIVLFECENCGGEVAVNYAKSASKDYFAECERCCTVYTVGHDAENDNGTWKDLTKIHPYQQTAKPE